MVLANNEYRTRLRALVSRFLDEAQLGSDFQVFELTLDETVAVEIDIATVRSLEPAVILLPYEGRDPSMRLHLVPLYLAPPHTDIVLQLAPNGIECIMHRNIRILVRLMLIGRSLDHDFLVGNGHVDSNLKQVTPVVVLVWRLHNDVTPDDVAAVMIEVVGALTYCIFERRRRLHVSKRDFEWLLHVGFNVLLGKYDPVSTLDAASPFAELVIMPMRIGEGAEKTIRFADRSKSGRRAARNCPVRDRVAFDFRQA